MARDTAIIQIAFSYRRDKHYLSEGGKCPVSKRSEPWRKIEGSTVTAENWTNCLVRKFGPSSIC